MQRINLGSMDAVPAAGDMLSVRVTANSGQALDIMVDQDRARIFAEAITKVINGWSQPAAQEPVTESLEATRKPVKKARPRQRLLWREGQGQARV